MRVSIRCAKVKILTSDSGDDEIVVVLEEVNQNDLFNAFSMLENLKLMAVEEIEPLEIPEELGL